MNDQRNGGIAWTDFTSNPIRYRNAAGEHVWACVKVSPGCAHCYSATTAQRFDRGTDYNAAEMAKLTPFLDEKELRTLLTSKKISGQRVFPYDMTDLFGEWVPFELIDRWFAVMALRPDVTFQILTKRQERMREYFSTRRRYHVQDAIDYGESSWLSDFLGERAAPLMSDWPLPNVWLGVSVENQETADQRIPALLNTPAAVRFVSYEPAIAPIDFFNLSAVNLNGFGAGYFSGLHRTAVSRHLDWVIVGGESGPGARPFDIEWARSTVRQCWAAGVPVFVKQLGSVACSADNSTYVGNEITQRLDARMKLKDRKGGDPSEWPEDLRVREFPAVSR